MKKMIIKVQLSLGDNIDGGTVLLQNESKVVEFMIEDAVFYKAMEQKLEGDVKGYFEAEVSEDNDVVLGKKIGPQKW